MATVQLTVPDMSELKAVIAKYAEGTANPRLQYGFEQFLNYLADRARERAPVRTGTLKASITYNIDKGLDSLVGIVGTNEKYAPYVEMGTGIYGPSKTMIRPKKAKILAWVSSGARPTTAAGWKRAQAEGRAVFAKEVKGMRPRPFLAPAVQDNMDKIVRFLKEALE